MAKLRVLGENPPPPRGNGENQLRELRDYLTRMKDELEFLLTHLGEDNLDGGLTEYLRRIREQSGQISGIQKKITDIEGEISDIDTALSGKQDALTFDDTPTSGSSNPVKSGGVYSALSGKQNTLTFDNSPTNGSSNPVKSGGVFSALAEKQNTLTFDNAPTSGSDNPVKSGGIYTALGNKEDADRFIVVNTTYITLSSATWDEWITGNTYGILMYSKPAGYHPVSAEISRFSAWPTNLVPVCHHSNGNVYLLSQLAKTDIGTTRVALRVLLEKD